MKKVEVEKLVSKMLIITGVILCVMFGTWLIQQGYFSFTTALTMPIVMICISAIFAAAAIASIVLGATKSSKYYQFASWFAALATFAMLLKINYEIRALEVSISGNVIKFFPFSLCILLIGLVICWICTIVKIVRN